MPESFAERFDIFCEDFAAITRAFISDPNHPEEHIRRALLPHAYEDDREFRLRVKGAFKAYTYVSENRAAFQNAGFLLATSDGCEQIEGNLLYALCLHIAVDEASLEKEPNLEQIIDTALCGPV